MRPFFIDVDTDVGDCRGMRRTPWNKVTCYATSCWCRSARYLSLHLAEQKHTEFGS